MFIVLVVVLFHMSLDLLRIANDLDILAAQAGHENPDAVKGE